MIPHLLLVLTLIGCSDPLDTIVPGDVRTWEGNTALRDAAQTLGEEDRRLLVAYTMRHALSGPGPDAPLREVLADQRTFEVEAARRATESAAVAQRVAAEREAAQREMLDVVTVGVASFEARRPNYRLHRYSEDIAVTVGFANQTDRPIRSVRGVLHFADSFNAPIKSVGITYENGIAPQATAAWDATLNVNQFVPEDVKLFTSDPTTFRIRWEPTDILFADGTLLSAEVR